MLRKRILTEPPEAAVPLPGARDVAALATVLVTSEAPEYPIDNAFNNQGGPGGSRWVAQATGVQQIILAFDTPQTLRTVGVEIEELEVSRSQELQMAVSRDGGQTYQEVVRQGYNFSPPGTTFEREVWTILAEGVTHLQLLITPDRENRPCRATLTTLALQ